MSRFLPGILNDCRCMDGLSFSVFPRMTIRFPERSGHVSTRLRLAE